MDVDHDDNEDGGGTEDREERKLPGADKARVTRDQRQTNRDHVILGLVAIPRI